LETRKADTQRVSKLHFKHGIHSMLQCLLKACMFLENSPVALQGAFAGEKKCQC